MVSSKPISMRTPYNPAARRRILCVYPMYARSFGTFQHAYPFFGGRVRAFMPPEVLHVGELGDATDRLFEYLDHHGGRPRLQLRFETAERLPLATFPTPAYDLIPLREYFIASIQFSSGC